MDRILAPYWSMLQSACIEILCSDGVQVCRAQQKLSPDLDLSRQ